MVGRQVNLVLLIIVQRKDRWKENHALLVRLPTSSASSVSILREMSSAFTECVSAPLQEETTQGITANPTKDLVPWARDRTGTSPNTKLTLKFCFQPSTTCLTNHSHTVLPNYAMQVFCLHRFWNFRFWMLCCWTDTVGPSPPTRHLI